MLFSLFPSPTHTHHLPAPSHFDPYIFFSSCLLSEQHDLLIAKESPYALEMERQLLLNGAGVSSDRVTWQATGVNKLASCVHQEGVCTDVLFLPKSKGLFVSSGRGGVNLWTTQRIPKGGGIELLAVVQCCSKNVTVVRTLLVVDGGRRSSGRTRWSLVMFFDAGH